MTRVAAIDCGTNSIRLLVADVVEGSLTDVTREMLVVRLGQGVDATGRFADDALARTFAAVDEYAATCEELGVEAIRFVATSATRDAANRDVFLDGVRSRLGVTPEVVSGTEEAQLSFSGATSHAHAMEGPYLVVDLGGGSTELVLGTSTPDAAYSMDVGCVRMTERHLGHGEHPDPAGVEAAAADVRAALDVAAKHVHLWAASTLVGVAGTITTVTAHALQLAAYDRDRIDGATLPVDAVLASCDALLAASREERAAMGFMHHGRIDVISAGALVWREVVTRVRDETRIAGNELTEVVTSEHDILDGIALALGR